ncbi:MAG TPA: PQQ-binding-like beta-propeller repeat protein [Solirubrobacteraceae bacterium]
MSRPPRRRRLLWLVAGLVAVGLLAAGGALILLSSEPGDVSNPEVEFTATEPATKAAEPPARRSRGGGFDWPVYGFTKARTRYLPLEKPLRPPFAERWKVSGSVLLEFPPAMGRRSLYLLKNNGALYGISRKTGRVRWKRKLGYLAASQPAYGHNTVFVVLLQRGRGIRKGRVVAVSAKDGHTRWSRKLPSRAESSPLLDRGRLYFGSEDGTIYALRASDGAIRWKAKASGAVKGGLALANGRLFVGDYGGKFQAFRRSDGKLLWRTSGASGALGLRSGNFYSTPAAAYGRVYTGNTDGFVYSYAQSTGKLAWRKKTGNYVYGSPAVAPGPGGRPTVFIGSYDGRFYALDARSGAVRWSRRAEGRISGGAVVLGDLVFYSTLAKTTTALGVTTGRRVWRTQRGSYNPVVSNGRGIFLVGMTNLFGIDGRPPNAKRILARARHRRYVNRLVAQRRRMIARRVRLRRSGVVFCYRSLGRRVCHKPARIVCFKRSGAKRVTCRPMRRARR